VFSPIQELGDVRMAWGSEGVREKAIGVKDPESVEDVEEVRRLRRRVVGGKCCRWVWGRVDGERALDTLPRR
jgi:hypothetical protein